jgi:hypothetical protein
MSCFQDKADKSSEFCVYHFYEICLFDFDLKLVSYY